MLYRTILEEPSTTQISDPLTPPHCRGLAFDGDVFMPCKMTSCRPCNESFIKIKVVKHKSENYWEDWPMVELGGAMLQRVTNLGGTPDGSISRTSRHQQSNAMSMAP
jgi:hypothetical protein